MNIILSVIVPVFQAGSFLDRCISSILASTYQDIEILLVDDGSTDGSAAICDAWALKDPRITVIHKPNGGVSSARNEGLHRAVGKYITFVDADDYIAEDTFATALSYFQEDVCSVAYKASICDSQGIPFHTAPASGNTLFFATPLEALEYYWYTGKNTAVWCRIFLHEVITRNHILFDTETAINEEGLFITDYFSKCSGRAVQLNNRFYYYVTHEGSASRHITGAQAAKVMENYHTLIPYCDSLSCTCGLNIRYRYTEILLNLLKSQCERDNRNPEMRSVIRQELYTLSKQYLCAKRVPLRRKVYLISVLLSPGLTYRLAGTLKKHLLLQGKSW
ncbi:MAG: glycosyltransferase [Lachnospiraceae bacterium]|nr:glycosyltransferase [Lachnospiraceae bacterium]